MQTKFNHKDGQYLNIGNEQIYYELIGDKSKPILVMLHGGFGNIEDLNPISKYLSKHFNIIGIEDVGDFLLTKEYSNKVVLMVGGLGTRLKPLTNDTPKPLLKVGNKPILETIVENFSKYGFKDFIFSVNYKSEMIEEYFGNGKRE